MTSSFSKRSGFGIHIEMGRRCYQISAFWTHFQKIQFQGKENAVAIPTQGQHVWKGPETCTVDGSFKANGNLDPMNLSLKTLLFF